jgi:hypothetical protein
MRPMGPIPSIDSIETIQHLTLSIRHEYRAMEGSEIPKASPHKKNGKHRSNFGKNDPGPKLGPAHKKYTVPLFRVWGMR